MLDRSAPLLVGYIEVTDVFEADQLDDCDLVVSMLDGPTWDGPMVPTVRAKFTQSVEIPGQPPAHIFTNERPECVTTDPAPECWQH
jgi:hypothetical protein